MTSGFSDSGKWFTQNGKSSSRLQNQRGCLFLWRQPLYYSEKIIYSARKLLTGFAIAALNAWKLTVISAITTIAPPVNTNTHMLIPM